MSSAPVIPVFEPPEPTPTDEYPGYYQLPSGAWAAHDADYYNGFVKQWQRDYNAQVRALEKGATRGFEAADESTMSLVDAQAEMEKNKREVKEIEEKKSLTKGAGADNAAPKMTITVSSLVFSLLQSLKSVLRHQSRVALRGHVTSYRRCSMRLIQTGRRWRKG